MRPPQTLSISCLVAMLVQSAAASAQAASTNEDGKVFALGEVQVIGDRVRDASDDDRVSADEVWRFNTNTLTEALKLVPGVTSNFTSNGRRNEGDISVRGFDRWRVPLAIDGIRVYLPADNRIDFNRFLTPDLGEVQVRKGRVSVLDGPGAMGGMINLVTRKPTRPFESEVQGGASFDRSGNYDGWFGTAIVGTRMEKWYAQATATQLTRDSWSLSKDFEPVQFNTGVTPPAGAQDGGERQGSASEDFRLNVKAGFTPNDTDEYSLSYTRQTGEKEAPLGVDFYLPTGCINTTSTQAGCAANPGGRYQPNNFWTWPRWDVESGYFLSNTQFGDSTYLKTRASYSEFNNALYAWDTGSYETQGLNGRFRSYYHDSSASASVEAGTSFIADNTTKAAFIYRRDRHREFNDNRPTNTAARNIEPEQHNEEVTWSLALENTWKVTDSIDVIGGVSYDKNELKLAQEFGTPDAARGLACPAGSTAPCLYEFPTGNADSFNWQAATQYHYSGSGQVGFSVSSRTRFANNFERFSTRFGTNLPNPDLASERATHVELSWQANVMEGVQASVSVFYTDVKDLIQTVVITATPSTTQAQNVGDGEFYGIEVGTEFTLLPQLRAGANYSYLHREIKDALQPDVEATGAPDHLGFVYLAWQPLASLTVQPSFELAGNRWSDINGSNTQGYQRIGRYSLVNLQVGWQPLEQVDLVVGARNLLDKNFELAPGFPEPGRSLFTKVRWKF